MTFQPQPIRVRGQVFPSQRAAAQAFGVSDQTVSKAVEDGRLEGLGLGRRVTVTIDGRTFTSGAAAAAHHGVTYTTIWKWGRSGRAVIARPHRSRDDE